MKTKFGIRLYSQYTGEPITLGFQYNSRKEAEKDAEKRVCPRCNRIEIIPLEENSIWVNKEQGFVSKERWDAMSKEKEVNKFELKRA